jgi:prophage regulatory protein
MEDSIIRKPEVRKLTGLSDTTIWRKERQGQFPRRRRLSSTLVGWSRLEIMEWINSLPVINSVGVVND